MDAKHKLDERKCLEILVYVSVGLHDEHAILKALYLADTEHIYRYGRPLYGDRYRAMPCGPVADGACTMIQIVDNKYSSQNEGSIRAALAITSDEIRPLRKSQTKFLSLSDRECLDEAILICGSPTLSGRVDLTHDAAFMAAAPNGWITTDTIAETLPDADAILDYLHNG